MLLAATPLQIGINMIQIARKAMRNACCIYGVCVYECVYVLLLLERNKQPVLTALTSGLQLGPEILSYPFQGNWGLLFILGKVVENYLKLNRVVGKRID